MILIYGFCWTDWNSRGIFDQLLFMIALCHYHPLVVCVITIPKGHYHAWSMSLLFPKGIAILCEFFNVKISWKQLEFTGNSYNVSQVARFTGRSGAPWTRTLRTAGTCLIIRGIQPTVTRLTTTVADISTRSFQHSLQHPLRIMPQMRTCSNRLLKTAAVINS